MSKNKKALIFLLAVSIFLNLLFGFKYAKHFYYNKFLNSSNVSRSEISQDGIYFFGDSWTVGHGVFKTYRWTFKVSQSLGYVEHNKAANGQPLMNLSPANPTGAENFYSQAMRKIPLYNNTDSYIFFCHGINDMGLNLTGWDTVHFKSELVYLINTAIAKGWPKSKIKLTTAGYCNQDGRNLYTTYGVTTPSDLTRHLAFVRQSLAVGVQFGIQTFNFYSPLTLIDMQNDGLHPNSTGHSKLAAEVINNFTHQYSCLQ